MNRSAKTLFLAVLLGIGGLAPAGEAAAVKEDFQPSSLNQPGRNIRR